MRKVCEVHVAIFIDELPYDLLQVSVQAESGCFLGFQTGVSVMRAILARELTFMPVDDGQKFRALHAICGRHVNHPSKAWALT